MKNLRRVLILVLFFTLLVNKGRGTEAVGSDLHVSYDGQYVVLISNDANMEEFYVSHAGANVKGAIMVNQGWSSPMNQEVMLGRSGSGAFEARWAVNGKGMITVTVNGYGKNLPYPGKSTSVTIDLGGKEEPKPVKTEAAEVKAEVKTEVKVEAPKPVAKPAPAKPAQTAKPAPAQPKAETQAVEVVMASAEEIAKHTGGTSSASEISLEGKAMYAKIKAQDDAAVKKAAQNVSKPKPAVAAPKAVVTNQEASRNEVVRPTNVVETVTPEVVTEEVKTVEVVEERTVETPEVDSTEKEKVKTVETKAETVKEAEAIEEVETVKTAEEAETISVEPTVEDGLVKAGRPWWHYIMLGLLVVYTIAEVKRLFSDEE